MNAAAELVGGFGDADLAVGGGRGRGGQRAGAGGAAEAGGLGDQFLAAGLDLLFDGKHSRLPELRRAVSCPVWIQW